MSDQLLERFIDMYIQSQTTPQVQFCWHGGESLMRPLSFYKRVVELQQKYAAGHIIDNTIQTNGTLLNDEWCRFFKDNNWLVGVSIDGPQEFHDEYRRNKMGAPSFRKVMQGINLLKAYIYTGDAGVEYVENASLAEVTPEGAVVAFKDGTTQLLPCDTVILSVGLEKPEAAVDAMRTVCPETYVIGDCKKPRVINDAVREAFFAAMNI